MKMPGEQKGGSSGSVVQVGQLVYPVKIFEVIVNYNFGKYVFYFLKPDAVTVFLAFIGNKSYVSEIQATKKGKKYYLVEGENTLSEEIELIEKSGEDVKMIIDSLNERLKQFFTELNALEFGLTQRVTENALKDF